MQPETAFFLLSAAAQSAAALAGLSALVLLFLMRSSEGEWVTEEPRLETDEKPGFLVKVIQVPIDRDGLVRSLSSATVAFLLTVALSLGVLTLVSPGSDPIGLHILAGIALSLLAALWGGFKMALFVWGIRRWTRPVPVPPSRKSGKDEW